MDNTYIEGIFLKAEQWKGIAIVFIILAMGLAVSSIQNVYETGMKENYAKGYQNGANNATVATVNYILSQINQNGYFTITIGNQTIRLGVVQ